MNAPAICQATQHSDQMLCSCGLAWDVNDPEPPTCPATKQEARASISAPVAPIPLGFAAAAALVEARESSSTVSREEAHARLRRLGDQLRHPGVPDNQGYFTMHIGGGQVRVPAEHVMKATNPPGRMVVCAAISFATDQGRVIIVGPRHFDAAMQKQMSHHTEAPSGTYCTHEQGFIDQWGVFMTREEALIVAYHAGQLGRRPKGHPISKLFSEDLY